MGGRGLVAEVLEAGEGMLVTGADGLRLVRSLGCTDVHVETTDGRSIPLTDGS